MSTTGRHEAAPSRVPHTFLSWFIVDVPNCLYEVEESIGLALDHVWWNEWTKYVRSLTWWRCPSCRSVQHGDWEDGYRGFYGILQCTVCDSYVAQLYHYSIFRRALRPCSLLGLQTTPWGCQRCRAGVEHKLPSLMLSCKILKWNRLFRRRQWRFRFEDHLHSCCRSAGWGRPAEWTWWIFNHETLGNGNGLSTLTDEILSFPISCGRFCDWCWTVFPVCSSWLLLC